MKKSQKNWLVGFMLLVVCLVVAACSSGESGSVKKESKDSGLTTSVFEADLNGVKTEMTYTHKGDKVVKQETYSIVDYDALGIETKEEAEEMFSFVKDEYDIEGVTYKSEYKDTEMIENVIVDYEKADIQEVMALLGALNDQEDDSQKVKYISMKQSKEMLLEQGFTEKK